MTVTQKLFFKILSGYDVANGRTDRRTDGRERHTIIHPQFNFGRTKRNYILKNLFCEHSDLFYFSKFFVIVFNSVVKISSHARLATYLVTHVYTQ